MIKNQLTEKLCEFLGWYVGDGCISINERYSEFALTGDIIEEYPFYKNVIVPSFNKLFANYLNKAAVLKSYKSVGVCGIYIFDKSFISLLQTRFRLNGGKKVDIKIPPIVKSVTEIKHFLRGLCDTDGSIYFCKSNFRTKQASMFAVFHYKPKIKIATISEILIKQVYEEMLKLGFSPRLSKPIKQRRKDLTMYAVVLDTKRDVKKWIEEIDFRSQKHLTKIKVWKQFGFCPPHTTLKQRLDMLNGNLNPLTFYPGHMNLPLKIIQEALLKFLNVSRIPYTLHK